MVLDGVRVLDLTRLLPGPHCSQLLVQLGAEVIKLEDGSAGDYLRAMEPQRDGVSARFVPLNRGKRSLVLDLKQAAGREALLRLLPSCDVLLESFRPGVMDRLGLSVETLRQHRSDLIIVRLTGFGQDGPYRDRPGHDLGYLALSGALAATGTGVGQLAIPAIQMADIGGALHACVAVLAGLLQRDHGGGGSEMDIAMLDVLVSALAPGLAAAAASHEAPRPGGDVVTGRYPCYSVYACADGDVAVAALEPKFWLALVERLELPELSDGQFAEGDAGEHVRLRLSEVLATATREQWQQRLGDVCCVEPVLTLVEMPDNPQVVARGLIREDSQGLWLRSPIRDIHDAAPVAAALSPRGGDSRDLLRGAGYDDTEIDSLVARGVTR